MLEEDHHIQLGDRLLSTAFAPSWKLVKRDRINGSPRKVHPRGAKRALARYLSCQKDPEPDGDSSLHALCAWMGHRAKSRMGKERR